MIRDRGMTMARAALSATCSAAPCRLSFEPFRDLASSHAEPASGWPWGAAKKLAGSFSERHQQQVCQQPHGEGERRHCAKPLPVPVQGASLDREDGDHEVAREPGVP